MAWQKGPGEGYMEAKSDALTLCPTAVCIKVNAWGGVTGYVVYRDRSCDSPGLGSGRSARDAWNEALRKLRRETRKDTNA